MTFDPLRLHLGCGEVYLPGYVNADFPRDEHTVLAEAVADLYADGVLTIETPDFERMVRALRRATTARGRGPTLRHIFGSHEAKWAVHCDGWYPEKFEHVLPALGYGDLHVERSKWRGTHNVTVVARKRRPFAERNDQLAVAERLLGESLVDDSRSERRQLKTWLDEAASVS